MKLSVVIPAHNESGSLAETVETLTERLRAEAIPYEIVVVDDHSTDSTAEVIARLAEADPDVRYVVNNGSPGFGYAVRTGLDAFTGDAVAIVMADLSDSPRDIVSYYRLLQQGYDCAFGTRFMPGAEVHEYPRFKLVLNRIANLVIRALFRHGYNDTTNACKAYRREVIESIQPLVSAHFNLTVEMPLKAAVRGHTYAIIPISWTNRVSGESKLHIKEMGSRYLFIILYVFLEHHLSRGDYVRKGAGRRAQRPRPWRRRDDLEGEVTGAAVEERRGSTV
jgi:dolichol-phosphate mannosyltransferase